MPFDAASPGSSSFFESMFDAEQLESDQSAIQVPVTDTSDPRSPHRPSKASIQSLSSEVLDMITLWLPLDHLLLDFCLASKAVYHSSFLASFKSAKSYLILRMKSKMFEDICGFLAEEAVDWDCWKSLPFTLQVVIFHRILNSVDSQKEIERSKIIGNFSSNYALALVQCMMTELEFTPSSRLLAWACQSNYTEIVELSLKNPSLNPSLDVNAAFGIASWWDYKIIAKQLLRDPRFSKNHNYLNLLCKYGVHEELEAWLLDPRVDPSEDRSHALKLAVQYGHLEVVNILLADGRVNPQHHMVLWIAIKLGKLDIVERLLEDPRVEPSYRKNSALIGAAESGNFAVMKRLLLDPRIDLTHDNNTLFLYSCRAQLLPLVEALLLDGRVDPTVEENNALRVAVQNDHFDVVRLLVADSRVRQMVENRTPFFLSLSKSAKVVQLLLQHSNADLSQDSCSIFMDAVDNARDEIVQVLLQDPRFDPCSVNSAAFISAVGAQNETISKILLSDQRVVDQVRGNLEYFDNELKKHSLSLEFRLGMSSFLIQNGLLDLEILFH